MVDFILAALPFAAAGIAIAAEAARFSGRKRGKSEERGDCSLEGMCLGMSLGAVIGPFFPEYIGIGMSLGMIIGMLIGMGIKKRTN